MVFGCRIWKPHDPLSKGFRAFPVAFDFQSFVWARARAPSEAIVAGKAEAKYKVSVEEIRIVGWLGQIIFYCSLFALEWPMVTHIDCI